MHTLRLETHEPNEMVNITAQVRDVVENSRVRRGLCLVHVPHTTAGVTVQEGYDPDVARDILHSLRALVPHQGDYRHAEGNSDAHIKALVTGSSQTLPNLQRRGQPCISIICTACIHNSLKLITICMCVYQYEWADM